MMLAPTPGLADHVGLAQLGAELRHPAQVGDDPPHRVRVGLHLDGRGDRGRARSCGSALFLGRRVAAVLQPLAQGSVDGVVVEQVEVISPWDVQRLRAREHLLAAARRDPGRRRRARAGRRRCSRSASVATWSGSRPRAGSARCGRFCTSRARPWRRSRIPTERYSRIRPNGAASGSRPSAATPVVTTRSSGAPRLGVPSSTTSVTRSVHGSLGVGGDRARGPRDQAPHRVAHQRDPAYVDRPGLDQATRAGPPSRRRSRRSAARCSPAGRPASSRPRPGDVRRSCA